MSNGPFYLLFDNSRVLPDSDNFQLQQLIAEEGGNNSLRQCSGLPFRILFHYTSQSIETHEEPTSSLAHLHKTAVELFSLKLSSIVLHQGNVQIPANSTELKSFFPLPSFPIEIVVAEWGQAEFIASIGSKTLQFDTFADVAALYSLVSKEFDLAINSFFLSHDKIQLLRRDSNVPISYFHDTKSFHIIDASTIVQVEILGFDEITSPLGFLPETKCGLLFETIDLLFPEFVAFANETLCTRRPIYFNSSKTSSDPSPISNLADYTRTVKINLVRREAAIFAKIIIEGSGLETICAQPNLQLADMFECVMQTCNPRHYTFTGPDGAEIGYHDDRGACTIGDYVNVMNKGRVLEFHVKIVPGLQQIMKWSSAAESMINSLDSTQNVSSKSLFYYITK